MKIEYSKNEIWQAWNEMSEHLDVDYYPEASVMLLKKVLITLLEKFDN